ncbi:hypothetical protein FHX44_116679 [Pseudonocardia hierapolitana]|uniref:Uncharacterized protein n=1 Tax=Pseudonocardia hierapolitana TaxID=1128676 RepID=A0A561T0T4_9PSEU|nr:hypothetical protein [Pseudonocardia hierapolitana]TWF80736.1 hypothetical protein FHX44_116679 [Pseudonocardia hierapolitana]
MKWFDLGGVRMLDIDGTHPYVAAHVHVLGRYLDAPFSDGALVGFPTPENVVVCPLDGVNPGFALATLEGLVWHRVDNGAKAISRQVFW